MKKTHKSADEVVHVRYQPPQEGGGGGKPPPKDPDADETMSEPQDSDSSGGEGDDPEEPEESEGKPSSPKDSEEPEDKPKDSEDKGDKPEKGDGSEEDSKEDESEGKPEKGKPKEPKGEGEESKDKDKGEESKGEGEDKPEKGEDPEGDSESKGEGEESKDKDKGEDSESKEGEDGEPGDEGEESDKESDPKSESKEGKEGKKRKPSDKGELKESEADGPERPKVEPLSRKEEMDMMKAAEEEVESGVTAMSDKVKASMARHTRFEEGGEASGMPPPVLEYPDQDLAQGTAMQRLGERWYGPSLGRLQVLLQAQDSRKSYRDRTAGRLDLGRIYREELAVPGEPPRVFKRVEPGAKIDTAVSIMVDQSGSMGLGPGSRTNVATALMAAMGALLERLKIPSEIIGYSGQDSAYSGYKLYDGVHWTVYKSFEEPHFQVGRCVPVVGSGNGDYDTMRKFIPRLLSRPEPKKIFFVMIDGGMTNGPGDPTKCVKRVLDTAKKKGVKVFGFGMGADLSKLLGEDWVYVPDHKPGNFAREMIGKLTKLLIGG